MRWCPNFVTRGDLDTALKPGTGELEFQGIDGAHNQADSVTDTPGVAGLVTDDEELGVDLDEKGSVGLDFENLGLHSLPSLPLAFTSNRHVVLQIKTAVYRSGEKSPS